MDFKQVLIFGLFLLVPVFTYQCFEERELKTAAERRLRNHFQQALDPAFKEVAASCPLELYRKHQPQGKNERSLSPWRYVNRTRPDYFPSSYAEAECLCSGCILIENKENGDQGLVLSADYNSSPVTQTRMFLKRELCTGEDGPKYHLKPEYLEVTVGCTCVRPRL
ncbi:interleukin-17C [Halichoeres trimaculatus]|uniref:interleukin-17C n=1 Tax=Halichoeres trimaculatus TaxID=147232 RepID=UPI003D9F49E3